MEKKKGTISEILNNEPMSWNERAFGPAEFLTSFNCDVIPNVLFLRASQRFAIQWNDAGEVVLQNLTKLPTPVGFREISNITTSIASKRSELGYTFEELPWSASFIITDDLRASTSFNYDSDTIEYIQYMILEMVILALPEQWCEIVWDEIEDQIWQVIQSTCVPFLAVLSIEDVNHYLSKFTREHSVRHLMSLLKLLIRISTRLQLATPQGIWDLISEGLAKIEIENLIEKEKIDRPEELKYLQVLNQTARILTGTIGQPLATLQALQQINHHGSKRSNATIGLALGALLNCSENKGKNFLRAKFKWTLISLEEPSTMELLAQAMTDRDTVSKIPKDIWEDISLDLKILFTFCEVKKSSFHRAFTLLSKLIGDVESFYGRESQELILAGTAFINCCNSIRREELGDATGRRIARNGLLVFDDRSKVTSVSINNSKEAYLLLAISDSLLGRSSYTEATVILIGVLKSPKTPVGIFTRAALRLCKLNRRLQQSVLNFDRWSWLEAAVKNFYVISDKLKYEIVEEVICLLSALQPEDGAKIPQLPYIVRELTRYQFTTYQGSLGTRRNLLDNFATLRQYKNDLGLLCARGPELDYSRVMRDAFPKAEVHFVEMIGGQNWQRSKRIRSLQDSRLEETVKESETKFHDSAFGSSKDTYSRDEMGHLKGHSNFNISLGVSSIGDSGLASSMETYLSNQGENLGGSALENYATSINSNMSTNTSTAHSKTPKMPEANNHRQRSCYICHRLIEDISNLKQWRQHIFSDIRPYTCIIDDCDVDYFQFASRNEFQAHLMKHQAFKVWKCKRCHHTEGSRAAIEFHLSDAHPYLCNLAIDTLIEVQESRRNLGKQSCPFCTKIPGAANFIGHICHHLEEVSLFAIPRDFIEEGHVKIVVSTFLDYNKSNVEILDWNPDVGENYELIENTKQFAERYRKIDQELVLDEGTCTISCSCKHECRLPRGENRVLETSEDWEEMEASTNSYEKQGHEDLTITITRRLLLRKKRELGAIPKNAISWIREELAKSMQLSCKHEYIPRDKLMSLTSRDVFEALAQDENAFFSIPIDEHKKRTRLALRIYRDAPLLMLICLFELHDEEPFELLEEFLNHHEKEKIRLPLPRECPNWLSEKLAYSYQKCYLRQWAFQAAVFNVVGDNQSFPDGVIIPYISKEMISRGSVSIICKVKLDPSHQYLYKIGQELNPHLALKAVPRYSGYVDEYERIHESFNEHLVLHGLHNLDNDHIIKLLATYCQGEYYHFLYPFAECNLDHYMRTDPNGFGSPEMKEYKRFLAWVWSQMEGIATGIQALHENIQEDKRRRNVSTEFLDPNVVPRLVTGYHHDIKLSRILYFKHNQISVKKRVPPQGLLQISGFKLEKFHNESSFVGKGRFWGTTTYSAPERKREILEEEKEETRGTKLKISRPYDVWSFGCILMEVLVWVVYGSEGRNKFGNDRVGEAEVGDPTSENDAFFYFGYGREPLVRDSVIRWMWDLSQHPHIVKHPQGCLDGMLKLIREVLVVDPKQRPKASIVAQRLKGIAAIADEEAARLDTITKEKSPKSIRAVKIR